MSESRRRRRIEARERDKRLRDAGFDTDAMREDAREMIARATPEGWTSRLVQSRWSDSSPCKGCGSVFGIEDMGVATLTCRLEADRVVLIMFVVVCSACVGDETRLRVLADKSFPLDLLA